MELSKRHAPECFGQYRLDRGEFETGYGWRVPLIRSANGGFLLKYLGRDALH
jgi:hypothetical protein